MSIKNKPVMVVGMVFKKSKEVQVKLQLNKESI